MSPYLKCCLFSFSEWDRGYNASDQDLFSKRMNTDGDATGMWVFESSVSRVLNVEYPVSNNQ